jgi:hypothetical protein
MAMSLARLWFDILISGPELGHDVHCVPDGNDSAVDGQMPVSAIQDVRDIELGQNPFGQETIEEACQDGGIGQTHAIRGVFDEFARRFHDSLQMPINVATIKLRHYRDFAALAFQCGDGADFLTLFFHVPRNKRIELLTCFTQRLLPQTRSQFAR